MSRTRALPVVPPFDLPGRREVLKLIGMGAAAAMLPGCKPKASGPTLRFFTAAEAAAMSALADGIFPPDDVAGGAALGAVMYIDHLLSAFDVSPPEVLSAGPFSGRYPYANPDGTESSHYPPNEFTAFLPLDRYGEAHWRLYLYGSDAVGGGPNDAVLGKTIGLRDQIRNGLQTLIAQASPPLPQQSAEQIAWTITNMDPTLQTTLVQLVAQGVLSVPEYQGNINGGGWKICNYEGDVQPFGFTQYDTLAGKYVERADAPTSTPDPGPDPFPMDSDTETLIGIAIVSVQAQKSYEGGSTTPIIHDLH